MAKDFFNLYFEHVGDTESPMIFHRWSIISAISANLGRRAYVPLGHYKIWPNMFNMLVGVSGCRKDSAINIAKALMKESGYNKFSSNKTSKEKFIQDLCDRNHAIDTDDEQNAGMQSNLDKLADMRIMDTDIKPAECFIALGEFQDFLGQNNLDFITMLGALWDVPDTYEHRIKTGRSPLVDRPIVSILGGSTPTGFSLIFPPEIIGQGFLSRLILIYGEPTFKKIAWPSRPVLDGVLVARLREIRKIKDGSEIKLDSQARALITKIYNTSISVEDPRFASYQSRRHIHLLKICAVLSCLNHIGLSGVDAELGTITAQNVLEANTILAYTEQRMPLALGEFGRGRYSEVSNLIMEELSKSDDPKGIPELWKVVGHDLNSQKDLLDIMRSLLSTEKVQSIVMEGQGKFLPNRKRVSNFDASLLDLDILTEEERLTSGF